MAQLDIKGLRLEYSTQKGADSFLALQDVDLAVEQGEFITVVGPSGCGKSSLLMMIAALIMPTSGEISLNGRPVRIPGRDRALVFQDFALLPWRTVLSNVELGLEIQGLSATERRKVARRFLAMVGLQEFEKRYPHQLSGGMRQRVAIARALSVNPEILLMDEPFGALDAQIRQVMGSELLRIWEREKKTIIFITHDIDEAIYLGDRVIVMSSSPGRVVKDIRIDLPRPRPLESRNSSQFISYREQIWGLLEREVRASGSWAPTLHQTEPL